MANEDPTMTPLTATQERPPDAPPPAAPAQDAQPAQVGADRPDIVLARGGFYPRWPLLAALVFLPCLAIGYGFNVYYNLHPCPFGSICQLDTLPPAIQVLLMLGAFALLWLLVFLIGIGQIEDLSDESSDFAHFVRDATNFEPVRGLLLGYGALTLLGMIAALMEGLLYPALIALAVLPIVIALCLLIQGVQRGNRAPLTATQRRANVAAAARSPLYVFRNLPGINRIWPTPGRQ